MSDIYGAAGVLIKVRFSPYTAPWAEIPNLQSYTPPKSKTNIISTPEFGVRGLKKLPGQTDEGDAEMMFWEDPADTVHIALYDAYATKEYVHFQETLQTGQTREYSSLISAWEPQEFDNDKGVGVKTTMAVSGEVTRAG